VNDAFIDMPSVCILYAMLTTPNSMASTTAPPPVNAVAFTRLIVVFRFLYPLTKGRGDSMRTSRTEAFSPWFYEINIDLRNGKSKKQELQGTYLV